MALDPKDPHYLMKPQECGEEGRTHPRFWTELAARGEIQHVRVGRFVRIERQAFEDYLTAHTYPVSA